MIKFSEEINNIVKNSKAYDNNFFNNSKNPNKKIKINDLIIISLNWYVITKQFGLSSQKYNGVLAKELLKVENNKSKYLEHLLIESVKISSDDLGIGHENLYNENGGENIHLNERIHYKLWENIIQILIEKIQKNKTNNFKEKSKNENNKIIKILNDNYHYNKINTNNLKKSKLIFPSTSNLAKKINTEFMNIKGGICIYEVVESIAYNIIIAYSNLIEKVKSNEKTLFSKKDLIYIEIHKPLEKDHYLESTKILDLAEKYFETKSLKIIKIKVKEIIKLFEEFWEEMNKQIFMK